MFHFSRLAVTPLIAYLVQRRNSVLPTKLLLKNTRRMIFVVGTSFLSLCISLRRIQTWQQVALQKAMAKSPVVSQTSKLSAF